MSNCLDFAQFFIVKAYEDGQEGQMTNMKLQKLLYYAQSLHLALFDECLFEDEIQAWRYGPVCPKAYHFYSKFEAEQLPIPDQGSLAQIPNPRQDLLQEVWDYFGQHHAYYLSGMTHVEFPWKKARKGLPSQARSTEPIAIQDMKLLGHQKLDEIERDHPDYQRYLAHLLDQAFEQPTNPPKYIQEEDVNDWLTSLLS